MGGPGYDLFHAKDASKVCKNRARVSCLFRAFSDFSGLFRVCSGVLGFGV